MNEMTPQQMRELAGEDPYSARDWVEDAQEALRAAADQIEARDAHQALHAMGAVS